jgi:hypothetical protein
MLQFVQATVAVEILLGDKTSSDLIGLGELLANRIAYSLANNPEAPAVENQISRSGALGPSYALAARGESQTRHVLPTAWPMTVSWSVLMA